MLATKRFSFQQQKATIFHYMIQFKTKIEYLLLTFLYPQKPNMYYIISFVLELTLNRVLLVLVLVTASTSCHGMLMLSHTWACWRKLSLIFDMRKMKLFSYLIEYIIYLLPHVLYCTILDLKSKGKVMLFEYILSH